MTTPTTETVFAEPLTVRERQVAAAIARGLRNKQIADELGISAETVRACTRAGYIKHRITEKGRSYDRTEALMVLVGAWLRHRRAGSNIKSIMSFVRREMLAGSITAAPYCCIASTLKAHEVTNGLEDVVMFAAQYPRSFLLIPVGQFLRQIDEEMSNAPLVV